MPDIETQLAALNPILTTSAESAQSPTGEEVFRMIQIQLAEPKRRFHRTTSSSAGVTGIRPPTAPHMMLRVAAVVMLVALAVGGVLLANTAGSGLKSTHVPTDSVPGKTVPATVPPTSAPPTTIPAGSKGGWVLEPSPSPGSPSPSFSGLSCPTASNCTAVGEYFGQSVVGAALAEHWDGSAWKIQDVPDPKGSKVTVLDAVSCPSAGACVAVGSYDNSSRALAERWNGTSWTITPTPALPRARAATLDAVSCLSAADCTAVGGYTSSGVDTLVERWDGSRWTIEPSPNPTANGNNLQDTLAGVSCVSASFCVAVGEISTSSVILPLALVWNGHAWTRQLVPTNRGSIVSLLGAVSCGSESACTAVGGWEPSTSPNQPDLTLAVRFDGSKWAIQATPNVAGSSNGDLSGVSCPSATSCLAVGGYADSSGASQATEQIWNGRAWVTEATPAPAGSALSAISCLAARSCSAVGGTGKATLAEKN